MGNLSKEASKTPSPLLAADLQTQTQSSLACPRRALPGFSERWHVHSSPKSMNSTPHGDIGTVDKWSLEELELICRGCGLKSTRQLRAILEILTTATDHPNALAIYDRAPATIGISLATVYRSLRRLIDCGIVVRLQSGEKEVRYVVAPMQGKPNRSKQAMQTS